MSTMPLVTLAVTTCNRTRYLSETLACVCAQDYAQLDILVSDNGSQDQTPVMARALVGSDPRVRFRRNDTTVPLHEHFTQCVRAARGEYFILLHDDDLINSCFVSEVVRVVARHPDIKIVAPVNVVINEQGAIIRRFPAPDSEVLDGPAFVRDWLHHEGQQVLADVTTVLVRTDLVRHFGGYQGFGGGRNIDNLLFLQCGITSRIGFAHQAVFYWRSYSRSYGSNATCQQIAASGQQFMRHLRRDRHTVLALEALPWSRRRSIVHGVRQLTARELLEQMKVDPNGFRLRIVFGLLARRRDCTFLYLVCRECLRRTAPTMYYALRDMSWRFRGWLGWSTKRTNGGNVEGMPEAINSAAVPRESKGDGL